MTKKTADLDWERRNQQISDRVKGCFNRCGLWFMANQPIVDKTSQFCYLFGLLGVAGWGVTIAIPFLYSDCEPWKEIVASFVGYFSAIQVLVNWFCIKFVDCSYNPFIHGTKPDDIAIGENICEARNKNNRLFENGNSDPDKAAGKKRKDATAVPMASLMYVATELPTGQNPLPKRTAYPYFSWTPCLRCNRPRPPRCHHCPLCDVCVMKRDHHCFFAGTCIGYRNQRYFSVFIFWTTVATVFATAHAVPFFYYEVYPGTRWIDVMFPFAILRALFGYISGSHALLIVLAWLLVAFLMLSISFVQRAYSWLVTSTTSFEQEYKMNVLDTRDISEKLRSVFGKYWVLNFLIPTHFIFEVEEDPLRWPTIRA